MLYWHNPFPIYDATYVFRVYPRKKTTGSYKYYTTFFWGNDGTFTWNNGNANTYYGAHPYPIPAPSGPGQWEISVYSNDFVTGTEVQWDRWYTQVFRAWRESPSVTHHEFYYDWPDTSKVITHTVNDSNWAKTNPPLPAIVMGQAPDLNGASWGGYPGWEEFKGIIRGIQIYSGLLSMADLQMEINAPQSTTTGQNLMWYLNLNPRPGDVTDKKGSGVAHNPLWAGTTALEWTDASSGGDTSVPSTPANLVATVVSSSRIDLAWLASIDNVGVTGYRLERCQGSACSNFTQIATPGGITYSDTGLAASTVYRYRVRAADAAGNLSLYSSVSSATTSVAPDATPPTVSITFPTSGAAVSNTISIAATASDNVGVAGVQFKVDGTNVGSEDTSAPFSMSWNTLSVANGARTLTAVARDAAGNLRTSAGVAVTVANGNEGYNASYSITEDGGQSWTLTATSSTAGAGYARLVPATGSPSPSGIAILGLRTSAGLITEATVPASPETLQARAYVELGNAVRTGIAFANARDQNASISFYFTDSSGNDLGSGSFALNARQQTSAFFDQPPFNRSAPFQGTFTFTSSVPVAAVALRNLANERGESVVTTLPAIPLGSAGSGVAVMPHFADGGGWRTSVILTNLSDVPSAGTVNFFAPGTSGQVAPPVNVSIGGVTNSTFAYTIPARTAVRWVTGDSTAGVQTGSIRVTPSGSITPSVSAIFSFRSSDVTVSEASVSSAPVSSAFQMYAEASGGIFQIGTVQTGFALANPGPAPVAVTLELSRLDGSSWGPSAVLSLPAGGQTSMFIQESIPSLTSAFRGFLKVSSASPVAMIGLRGRYNERGDFLVTATPPLDLNALPLSGEQVFPHFLSGGGFATQFILFGESSSGQLSLSSLNGVLSQ